MSGTGADVGAADEIRAETRRDYPGWNPRLSLAGRWWARTIDTHTPERLRVFLFGQEGFAGEGTP